MKLSALIDDAIGVAGPDFEITGITADSRSVRPGDLFAALPGKKADGTRFVADAIAKGAAAILLPHGATPPAHDGAIAIAIAAEPRRALAMMAVRFHGPAPEHVFAVTGTSGKTSVAEFTRQIFAHLGHASASLGTMGLMTSAGLIEGALTTPDPIALAATTADLRRQGITHLAMEASSHGLDQHRLDGLKLVAGAFTNLGRDHLDYHPTIEAYLDAKLRLFRELLPPEAGAVINTDGAYAGAALDAARTRGLSLVTVGIKGETLRLEGVAREGFKQRIKVVADGRTYDILLPLVGAYQVENALVAAGLAHVMEPIGPVLEALAHLTGVNGRLDIVGEHRGGLAVVDYAHKPEALIAALDAVRPFATGKLICVFGCGGDRDRGKRPIMGRIAAEKADVVIVTDDNPRSEVPTAIRAEIMAGCPDAREIGDRGAAIRTGVTLLGPGDVLLVAGKGHETGQKFGDVVLPFSDHEVVRAALQDIGS